MYLTFLEEGAGSLPGVRESDLQLALAGRNGLLLCSTLRCCSTGIYYGC